ncbi:hypothetical protein H5410_008767 [Solanum commersonii]|uniref:Uncharacterized protein n=1 Tax=Solanum commersonii TaxID=4109 RepID=A0A9J6AFW3_SOLCO|nr:hypothetical protein H5410_008767 [Solanum commersonii]
MKHWPQTLQSLLGKNFFFNTETSFDRTLCYLQEACLHMQFPRDAEWFFVVIHVSHLDRQVMPIGWFWCSLVGGRSKCTVVIEAAYSMIQLLHVFLVVAAGILNIDEGVADNIPNVISQVGSGKDSARPALTHLVKVER